MTASLLQIVAVGNEDYMLHGNPQISYFKSVNLKYVNFSMERIESLPKTSVKTALNNITETVFQIDNNNIDALGNVYIKVDLPNIKSKFPYEFEWIDSISDYIIERADFIINSNVVETIDSNIIHMFKKNNSNSSNEEVNKSISETKLTNVTPTYTFNDTYKIKKEHNMLSINKLNTNYNRFNSINKKTVYVRLPFFFSKNEIKLPNSSLRKSKLSIRVYFRAINELYRIKTTKKVTLKSNPNIVFDFRNTDTYQQLDFKTYETYYSNNYNLYDFIENKGQIYDNVSLVSYVYFFDKIDTEYFSKKTNILVNKYAVYRNIVNKISNELIIENNDLVKELIVIPQRNDIKLRNNHNYYGIHDSCVRDKNMKKWYNYYYEICYNQYRSDLKTIAIINEKNEEIIRNVIENMNKIDTKSYIVFNYYDNKNRHKCFKQELNNNNLKYMLNFCKSGSDEYHSPFLYYGMFQNISNYDVISIRPYYFRYKLLNLNYKTEKINSLCYLPTIYANNNTIFLYFDQPVYTSSIITENIFVEADHCVKIENIKGLLNQWNMRSFKNIPFINDDNYDYFKDDICIKSIDIKHKGNSIMNIQDKTNLYKTTIFNHYKKNINIKNIVKIPFCLKPNDYKPSGHINLENIDRLLIETKIKNIFNTDPILEDNKIKLDIYLSTINILIINDNRITFMI